MAYGMLPPNVGLVKPPHKAAEPKGRTVAPTQARRLLAIVQGDRLEAFHLVLLTSGVRRSEALGLRWAGLDVNGPSPTLRVRQQLQWPGSVPTLQDDEPGTVGAKRWRADGMVFNGEDGDPLRRNTITKQFQVRAKAAGLPPIPMHDLRHADGSLLMSQRMPHEIISELMGHASIDPAADAYLQALDVQVRNTARSVEMALEAPVARAGTVCATCAQTVPGVRA